MDSVSGWQEATRIANETKKELNKMWKLLEVGLDGIYCPLLLLNKKKARNLSPLRLRLLCHRRLQRRSIL